MDRGVNYLKKKSLITNYTHNYFFIIHIYICVYEHSIYATGTCTLNGNAYNTIK